MKRINNAKPVIKRDDWRRHMKNVNNLKQNLITFKRAARGQTNLSTMPKLKQSLKPTIVPKWEDNVHEFLPEIPKTANNKQSSPFIPSGHSSLRHQTAFEHRRGSQQASDSKVGVIYDQGSNMLNEPSTSVVLGSQIVKTSSIVASGESRAFAYDKHFKKSALFARSNLPQ